MAIGRTSLAEGIQLAKWLAMLGKMRKAESRQRPATIARDSAAGSYSFRKPSGEIVRPPDTTPSKKRRIIPRGPGGSAIERWAARRNPPRRYSTAGASRQKTAQQKINYMKKGLKVQAEVAREVRQGALSDILAYKRARDAEKGSSAISQMEQLLIDKLSGQGTQPSATGGQTDQSGGKVVGDIFRGAGPFYRPGGPETFPIKQWIDELGLRHIANTGMEYYDYMTRQNVR